MLNSLYRHAVFTEDLKVSKNAFIGNSYISNVSVNSLVTSKNLTIRTNTITDVKEIRANATLEIDGVTALSLVAEDVMISTTSGNVDISGANSSTVAGGDIIIKGGSVNTRTSSNTGGDVLIAGGDCAIGCNTSNSGGNVMIRSGAPLGANGSAGSVYILASNGGTNNISIPGNVVIKAGNSQGNTVGGTLTLTAGDGSGEQSGGDVLITAGNGGEESSRPIGNVIITTPDVRMTAGYIEKGGNIEIKCGKVSNVYRANGGNLLLYSGMPTTTDNFNEYVFGGELYISTSSHEIDGTQFSVGVESGALDISTGSINGGNNEIYTGAVNIQSGNILGTITNPYSEISSGTIEIHSGSTTTGKSGEIRISTGTPGTEINSRSGNIHIYTDGNYTGSNSKAGTILIYTGNGSDTQSGGDILLTTGTGGTTGNGGNLTLKTGIGNGGGVSGSLKFAIGSSYYKWPSAAPAGGADRFLKWINGAGTGTSNDPYRLSWV